MMKKIILFIFLLSCIVFNAQKVVDFKDKTSSNQAERKIMLDLVRKILQKDYQQEFIFTVNKFNVSSNYAWLESDVQRKDGKPVKIDNDIQGCCAVEALYKKVNGKWKVQEIGAFSTDLWYYGIWDRTNAPRVIFQ